MNRPLWMYLAWIIAAACVAAMIFEASRVTVMPSTRPGCLWFCDVQPDALTCVQQCPEPRARAPPGP